MTEFFIRAASFAAPFVSDTSTTYRKGASAREALEQFAATYDHPSGLYAAEAYVSADAYHKGAAPLARWLSNHEIAKQEATAGKGSYSYSGSGAGNFEVNGSPVQVEDPKGGRVVDA